MNNRKTIVINLYGGPGTGKSTTAALFYHILKSEQYNVELVREYAKNWAYEKRDITAYDQIYLLGKQVRYESMLYGKVDVIITDAPVMMNVYYAQRYCELGLAEGVRGATLAFYKQAAQDGHKHIHVLLNRNKPYSVEGRYQTEDEAKEIDIGIKRLLMDLRFPLIECQTDNDKLTELLSKIKEGNFKSK